MQDAAQRRALPLLFQDSQAVRPGLAAVDHDREAVCFRQFELAAKHGLLHVARRMIVMIIEAISPTAMTRGSAARRTSSVKCSSVASCASCGWIRWSDTPSRGPRPFPGRRASGPDPSRCRWQRGAGPRSTMLARTPALGPRQTEENSRWGVNRPGERIRFLRFLRFFRFSRFP